METMTINVYGYELTLTAEETTTGAKLTVTTGKGEYVDDQFTGMYDDGEDGLARMLFGSLAPLGEVEQYPTYRAWCNYLAYMGDNEPEPMETFDRWCEELERWQAVADGLTADKTLQYLSDHYNI